MAGLEMIDDRLSIIDYHLSRACSAYSRLFSLISTYFDQISEIEVR